MNPSLFGTEYVISYGFADQLLMECGISKLLRTDDLDENLVLPPGFEPGSKPREGFMIGHYTKGAQGLRTHQD